MRWGTKYSAIPHGKMLWHSWFAWYPVQLESGLWVWLEWVSRRYHRMAWGQEWQYTQEKE